jgi:SIR2-like domain
MCSVQVWDAHINLRGYQDHLLKIRRSGGLVALLGSGISIWKPSNLPAGQEITKALARILIPSSVASLDTVRGLIERSAFEHIMFRYPKPDKLKIVFSDTFAAAPPNPVHESFARLIDRGIIDHVITTNYDLGLETACGKICRPGRQPQVVVASTEAFSADWSKPILFKIHGCARSDRYESIISNYEEEGELDSWKRNLLRHFIEGRDLLVCGYSGYDFEICPELASIKPRAVHWNSLHNPTTDPDALTTNAWRVLHASRQANVIAGNMLSTLSLLDRQFTANRELVSADRFVRRLVESLLEAEPDDWEFDRWRIWALNGTGCSKDGIAIGNQMVKKSGSPQRLLESLFGLAEPLFHGGFYVQSAIAYAQASKIALHIGELEKRIQTEVNVAECYRASGHWLHAYLTLRKAAKLPALLTNPQAQKKLVAAIALKKVLLQQHLYQISDELHLPLVKTYVRRAAKKNLRIVADSSRRGSWFDFQHCEMIARRFGLRIDDFYDGPLAPTSSGTGFKQLGYFLGEMLYLRDELLKPSTTVEPSVFRSIDIAHEIGCNAVVWKLSRAVARKVDRAHLPTGFEERWKQAWNACEYTPLMRLFLTTLGRRYS